MPIRRCLFPLLVATALTTHCLAQRVVLPGATGGVTPPPGWTVLRQQELDAEERATDPESGPARLRLLGIVNELQLRKRTDQNVVFHQPGPQPDHLRMVNAYSADGATTSAELQGEAAVNGMREALEPMLSQGGAEAEFVDSQPCELLDVGGVRLSFRVTAADLALQHHLYVFPAGEKLQYFECLLDRDDADAVAACEQLIATFDGAAEHRSRWTGLWVGGLAGALAGIVTALARRKRQARAIAADGAATASGRQGADG
ncbi:MAG: hypothetical protein KAI24_05480 [Planctomycetes bacterium]|nr:hypothetical protein [Planctomycetota bacterium]